jgi:V/A-type H+/Na+-transporting ATPase subunit C
MKNSKKLKYEFNPYTFARISAMKSLLLKSEDYDRILKMSSSEIMKHLQEGVYGEEINKLSIKYSGIKLAENTLNRHLERVFNKLKIISDPSIEYLMIQYLKRYDFWNIKTLLRAKITKVPSQDLKDLILPVGSLKYDNLKQLYEKESVREIIESCGLINKTEFDDAIQRYEDTKDLSEVENLLDYHYYLDSVEFAKQIPLQGKLFKEFFMYEFDIYNIELFLKKIFFNLEEKDIENYVIYEGKDLSKKVITSLLHCKKLSQLLNILSKTKYREILPEISESDPLLRYEIILERFLLQKSILLYHQNPLTVDLVLGFMFAKEIEVRNLRVIIKSKSLEYTEDYVKNLIVIK